MLNKKITSFFILLGLCSIPHNSFSFELVGTIKAVQFKIVISKKKKDQFYDSEKNIFNFPNLNLEGTNEKGQKNQPLFKNKSVTALGLMEICGHQGAVFRGEYEVEFNEFENAELRIASKETTPGVFFCHSYNGAEGRGNAVEVPSKADQEEGSVAMDEGKNGIIKQYLYIVLEKNFQQSSPDELLANLSYTVRIK